MNRLALDRLEVGRGDVVLEVGFGGGDLLARLLRVTDGEVVGVDLSEAMVARARRRFRCEPRLRLHLGSVDALPLGDGAVDRACSVNNVYFWPDPAAAMRELARVLKPGGRLALCFEPPEELRKWPGHRFGFRMHDEPAVRSMMEAAGFVGIRRAEGRGRMPDRFLCLTGEREGSEAGA
ncbi:class I SAM-dependent methyltransferase [Sphingosinicella terrae]|uniref:class I SAM-dependent methyltransferase n=1 Tax=Sphingosinicella terrae TaxID=2172047 RepID=UPI000E0E0476|nr:methyltransferase domain-containing protein [Sphingosinicella terrae]